MLITCRTQKIRKAQNKAFYMKIWIYFSSKFSTDTIEKEFDLSFQKLKTEILIVFGKRSKF